MHFKYDNEVFNTSVIEKIQIQPLEGICDQEGCPVCRVIFYLPRHIRHGVLAFKVGYVELGQFFYDWKKGQNFFEFYILENHSLVEEYRKRVEDLVNTVESLRQEDEELRG